MSLAAVHPFVLALLLVISLLCLGSPAGAQPAALPPEAQLAFERGLAAAQQQDWDLAIRYFAEGYKAAPAPTHPPLLFNLGLAHAKAGHEVAAMGWLMAYLEAAPEALNASAVRTEIVRLDVAVESKIRKILIEAGALARQIPDFGRSLPLSHVAHARAKAGDIDGALATYSTLGFRGGEEELWIFYAERIARDGRIAEAEQVFSRWAGRVDVTGSLGWLKKQLLDNARRTIDEQKEKAGRGSSQPCFMCDAEIISKEELVVGLEGLLRQAAQFKPSRAVQALCDIAGSLDGMLVRIREGWRAHPAYRAR